jgi:prepilin-type N-terminal cleavage/methylation domain-containing protein/prepilin-type processing-associated H-X9-DG protein
MNANVSTPFRGRPIARAFSLIELLVVIAIVALLASLLLAVLNKARGGSQAAHCRNNLKQLALACAIYVSDNEQCFPPPLRRKPWVLALGSSGLERKILVCPGDKSASPSSALPGTSLLLQPRSFIMNGFTDWIKTLPDEESYNAFRKGSLQTGLKESAMQFPASTIIFGEKASNNAALYLDLFKPNGLYLQDLSESRHGSGATSTSGNANYAMGDGHVAVYPYGKATCPENLWAVLPAWRSDAALCRPR